MLPSFCEYRGFCIDKRKGMNEMEKFIIRPSIDIYSGVRVTKDTVLEFENENAAQRIENLTMHSVIRVKGEGYEGTYKTTIQLNEGDILIYEHNGRGYIKPTEPMVTIEEAIEELTCIKE